tara:strand:- start:10366 stop:13416 length:3051 start_codon:yes stop_codon:yes gene_type:complete
MKGKRTKKLKKEGHTKEILQLVEKKYSFFQGLLQNTVLHVESSKFFDILAISDMNRCVKMVKLLHEQLEHLNKNLKDIQTEMVLKSLQDINNEMSSIIRIFGTRNLDDLLQVCIGPTSDLSNSNDSLMVILRKYFHPCGYCVISNKYAPKQPICEEMLISSLKYHMRVYGVKLIIYDEFNKKTIQITGVLDDVIVELLTDEYIVNMRSKIIENAPDEEDFKSPAFSKFLDSLTLKDFLINSVKDIYSKFMGYMNELKMIQQQEMSLIVKKFVDEDMFMKRMILIILLINSHIYENQYIAYLLYDTLTNDSDNTIDTQEQTILFDSFPWSIKELFRDAMKTTAHYTSRLSNFDINKIPLEQQICLMKVPDMVKEKAMTRLKELKSKSEDSGGKARQYLDGLLKIPFGVYKRENCLMIMDEIKDEFSKIVKEEGANDMIKNKKEYTIVDILNYIHNYSERLLSFNKTIIVSIVKQINYYIKNNSLDNSLKIQYVGVTKEVLIQKIKTFVENHSSFYIAPFDKMRTKILKIRTYMDDVKLSLDNSVYGHETAKKQISRIIGQWINGEQDGYCFGFEGPPGIGKTSIAKFGLANCLKDDQGNSRPFSMIQMGGDCQGSTLVGHSYTYVGSNWGNVVQILIDTKCMNPIIFIDEVDKVSNTEHGRELIGILTHLLDPTQNDSFQDKYFAGINIDVSRALFVLSYNSPEAIDRILLDRIHRVKFNALSLDEKIVISNKYLLPEVYKKMGLKNVMKIDDEIIKFIIEEFTFESGVRKLKEIFFDIVGGINLDILNSDTKIETPYIITKEVIFKYINKKHEVVHRKVCEESLVGSINGMYATSLGTGGILPITCRFYPCDKFLNLKLTGLQQEVMQESMHLSMTVAWDKTKPKVQAEIRKKYDGQNCNGINIHAGDLDIQKEGPSAGAAICCSIYSLFNGLKIKQNIGITGELSMRGDIMAIGGLTDKIVGSLKSNVNKFIYPKENVRQFEDFWEKYKDNPQLDGVTFHSCATIDEVFKIVFDK